MTYPTQCYKEIQVATKVRVLPSELCPNSGLSSRKVDAPSLINWTIIGQQS